MSFLSKDRGFWIRFRISIVGIVLFVGAVIVAYGAWDLGVVRSKELSEIAQKQYHKKIDLLAKRGMITDRNGHELAVEIEVDSIWANPRVITNPEVVAKQIAPILSKDENVLFKRLSSNKYFVYLKRKADPDTVNKIKKLNIEGINFQKESKRFYPNLSLSAHVTGFSGIDSSGLEGIERRYNLQLAGNKNATSGFKDALGNVVFANEKLESDSAIGKNIELTIDRKLQYIVETELANTIRLFEAKAGHIIVMDPHSGEVLAMANWPTFNLNDLKHSTFDQRRNRAVLDVFEPGSTLKVFTLAAALNSKRVKPDEKIFCHHGTMQFYDVILNDDHRDGWLSPMQCLKRSSNICFAKMAKKIGRKRLYRYLRRFGFGEKTNIQLPFEKRGTLLHFTKWNEFLTATIAFGQGLGVTGIQMTTALGAIANGGKLMKPSLVKRISDSNGKDRLIVNSTVRRRVISRKTARLISDMMTAVTEDGGTGTQGALGNYLVAGKTGTAQKSQGSKGYHDDEKFVASFFGFVPANRPKLVISVVIDEPLINHYGGTVAAPVFRRIAKASMANMGVSPNFATEVKTKNKNKNKNNVKKQNHSKKDNSKNENQSDEQLPLSEKDYVRVPDLLGLTMSAALTVLSDTGLRSAFLGTGIAIDQVPEVGESLGNGEFVQVNFQPLDEIESKSKKNGNNF